MENENPVVVVGGGISGLAAAYQLHRRSPRLRLLILEARERIGGLIRTERVNGFVVEAGPDSFLASKPEGVQLCQELGIDDRLITPNPANRRAFVRRGDELFPIPAGLTGLVPSQLAPLLESPLFSTEGKERLAIELDVPPCLECEDETLATFIRRRFGDEVYRRLIEPLMAGIYAGDGEHLSLEATFPQLGALEREHGSIIGGLQEQAKHRDKAPRAGFVTPISGMQTLVGALSGSLPAGSIATGVRATLIDPSREGVSVTLETGRTIPARAVIVATPAFAVAELIGHLDAALDASLRAIPYASTATVTLAFGEGDVPRVLNGSGYVVPRAENRPVLACTWVTSKFGHRAPPGSVLIRLFFGRSGKEEVVSARDEELIALARAELKGTLGVGADPVHHWIFRWRRAMPQYVLGHLDRLTAIETALGRFPGIYLAGALHGVGIPDCIRSGQQAADALLKFV